MYRGSDSIVGKSYRLSPDPQSNAMTIMCCNVICFRGVLGCEKGWSVL